MKRSVKILAFLVLTLSLLVSFSACLDPLTGIPEIDIRITGNINFTDVTAAAFMVTNMSRTIDVTKITITQPEWVQGESSPADGPFSSTITGMPKSGQRSATYLNPSNSRYDAVIEYTDTFSGVAVNKVFAFHLGDEALRFLLLNPKDGVEFFIFRDKDGNPVITHIIYRNGSPTSNPIIINQHIEDTININNIIDNGNNGAGSSPPFILIKDREIISPFIIINRTLDQAIQMIQFVNSIDGRSYSIGSQDPVLLFSGIPINDRRAIALENNQQWFINAYINNISIPISTATAVVLPPSNPQSIYENYIHFYKGYDGGYYLSHEWPPVHPNPPPDAVDLLPPGGGTVEPGISSALLMLVNLSRSTDVDNVFITQQVQGQQGIETKTAAQFSGAPRRLDTKAQYLPPSAINYDIAVRIDGQDINASVLLANPRDIEELFIFRDTSGTFRITRRDNFPGGYIPEYDDLGHPVFDPFEGEGSMPAIIPDVNRTTIGTFIFVNQTRSQIVDNVTFRSQAGRPTYVMDGVNTNDRRSIGLSQGDWQVVVGYTLDNVSINIDPRTVVIVPSNDPQADREHYIYFYMNNRGGYSISQQWPPFPNDAAEEDILPPDNGHGRGLLKITNNTTALVTSVLVQNLIAPGNAPLFLNSEAGTGNPFAPPVPVQFNRTGYVDVVGTPSFPIDAHPNYLITVFMVSAEGEASFERQAYIKDQVVEIVINGYNVWDGCPICSGICTCAPPPGCNCDNLNCDCGDGCNCSAGGCDCICTCQPGGPCTCPPDSGCDCTCAGCDKSPCICGPGGPGCPCTGDTCTCGPGSGCTCGSSCTCVGVCTCTPGNCNCPPEHVFLGKYSVSLAKNTLIDTGLALRNDGRVLVWGFRGSGQQGNGTTVVGNKATPAIVGDLNNIVQVTGSAYTLVARDSAGNLYGWGQNLYGAAGVGRTGIVNRPQQIPIPVPVDYVAAGEYFFIARGIDGSVWTWGHNLYGQLGTGGSGNQPLPVKVNLPSGQTARVVGAAYEGAFAVTHQGNVYAWGDNEASGLGFQGTNYGTQQIHRSPAEVISLGSYASQITYIAGGNGWGQALLGNGTVIGWGLRASLGQGVTSTSGSGGHTNGNVITVYNASAGKIVDIHSRYVGTIALREDGRIITWGQTGGSVFPTIYGASVTVKNSHGWGNPTREIGGGKEHIYYILQDNRFWGAGYGAANKLHLNTTNNRSYPGAQVQLP